MWVFLFIRYYAIEREAIIDGDFYQVRKISGRFHIPTISVKSKNKIMVHGVVYWNRINNENT